MVYEHILFATTTFSAAVGATVFFFHLQPSTILHLYPRYRVKRPCDGSVFQLRFTFVYGTGLNVPVLDSKHFHFQLNQFQVSNQQAQTST